MSAPGVFLKREGPLMPDSPQAAAPIRGVALLTVVHSSRGRVRFRALGPRYNDDAARTLEAALRSSDEVLGAHASGVTGTLLVEFRPVVDVERVRALVIDALDGRLRPANQESEAPARSKTAALQSFFERLFGPGSTTLGAGSTQQAVPEMVQESWHAMSIEETRRALGVGARGLTEGEAETRLAQTGPNRLPAPQPRSAWLLLWDQVRSVPVLLLVASAGISLFTGAVVDGLVIGAVVITNAAIGFATEKHAEQTIASLTASSEPNALVLREGRVHRIDAARITTGDVLPLSPGSYVAADARLTEVRQLTVAESALTGESAPVVKSVEAVPNATALADRRSMVYRGTVVTGGSALALVTATGPATEIGRIHALMSEASRPETPMELQLDVLGRQTAIAALGICGLTLLLGAVRGLGLVGTLQSAVALAVAALPEGLPSMATTSLATGMLRMRRHNVLARSLGAVEAVGAIDLLCLDKTGTLTMNRMTAVELYAAGQTISADALRRLMTAVNRDAVPHVELLLAIGVLCSSATVAKDDPKRFEGSATEVALLELAQANYADVRAIRRRFPVVDVQTRAEGRNYMVTVHEAPNGRWLIAMKGSPDQVLERCERRADAKGLRKLGKKNRARILAENSRLASKGRRVLAMAYREVEAGQEIPDEGFVWLGLVGLADPPRAEAQEAIQALHAAGISTRIVTGDQEATAYAIGQEIGLFGEREPVDRWDASNAGDSQLEAERIAASRIFSRVTPSQKLEIVRALHARGHIVAMTGDGINDGPALKAANVGVALGGRSTETARESADLILRDDDLRGLLVAIREGRTIHANIRQAVHFLIATNLSEVLSVLSAIALGMGQIVSPRQLLWLNLVTDILPVLALAVEPPRKGVLEEPPPRPDEPLISKREFPVVAAESALIAGAVGGSYLYSRRRNGAGKEASTMAFVTLSSAQLLHTLLSRSGNRAVNPDNAGMFQNYVPLAVAGSFGLQLLTMFTPLGGLIGLTRMTGSDLIVSGSAIAISSLGTVVVRRLSGWQGSSPNEPIFTRN